MTKAAAAGSDASCVNLPMRTVNSLKKQEMPKLKIDPFSAFETFADPAFANAHFHKKNFELAENNLR